jgi:DNA-binding LacI/PurR family transcriptional regulator
MANSDLVLRNVLTALRQQFNNSFAPGERLPSKRDLAAMYGVGPTTIHRALIALHKDGLIRPAPRVGWYRAGHAEANGSERPSASPRVAILSRRTRQEWDGHLLYTTLIAEAARRQIRIVEVPNRHRQRLTPGRARIELSRVPWNAFDVALLVEAEDTIVPEAPLLRKHKVLAVDQDAAEHGIDSVAFDDREVGAIAARYLHELGHLRFAVAEELCAPGFAWEPNWAARRMGFEWAVGRFGGTLLPHWRLTVAGRGVEPGEFDESIVASWAAARPKERPTALFVPNAAVIGPVIQALSKCGLSVPRDLSILTVTWGGETIVTHGMLVTSVDLKLSNLVARTLDIAAELAGESEKPELRSRPPRLIFAPALLIPGQSTAAPRQN